MTVQATAFAFKTSFRPETGPNKDRVAIDRKLVMIFLADAVADEYGTVIFTIENIAQNSDMRPEIIHATILGLQRDGYISLFDHVIREGWKEQVRHATVGGFAEKEPG